MVAEVVPKENTPNPRSDTHPLKVLFASSEAQPLIKTGGLADVAGSLPPALRALGQDVRLMLPAYPQAVEASAPHEEIARLDYYGAEQTVRLLQATLGNGLPVYLVDAPDLFDRPGNPYVNAAGHDWWDNADRFALFGRIVAQLSLNQVGLDWRPDLVHCNDWQTGLVPALLSQEPQRPSTLFTIHNLAYQGVFDKATFNRLGLHPSFWSLKGLEFHHQLSFIKGGIAFSDCVSTVSPTYAQEIQTAEYGCGLQDLLQHLGHRFSGILNGINYQAWNPSNDKLIAHKYTIKSFKEKVKNKLVLQKEFGLEMNKDAMLFGYIGRLVDQKGVDLILQILPTLTDLPNVQLVMLGIGDLHLEHALREAHQHNPGRVGVHVGYDEAMAHRVEAGVDSFLMPSRFEPCGLNQLYSLRYGSVPIVRRTGGLADTVVDANENTLANGTATGFVFDQTDATGLWYAVDRAVQLYQRASNRWAQLAINGMKQDFSWANSAEHYLALYYEAVNDQAPNPLAHP